MDFTPFKNRDAKSSLCAILLYRVRCLLPPHGPDGSLGCVLGLQSSGMALFAPSPAGASQVPALSMQFTVAWMQQETKELPPAPAPESPQPCGFALQLLQGKIHLQENGKTKALETAMIVNVPTSPGHLSCSVADVAQRE